MSTDDTTVQGTTVQDSGTAAQDTVTRDSTPQDGAADGARPEHRPGVRVGTVVWGLIVGLVGVGVLLVAAGYTIDVQLAAIVLLIAAGVGLILGPLVQGMRRSRTGRR